MQLSGICTSLTLYSIIDCYTHVQYIKQKMSLIEPSMNILAFYYIKKGDMGEEGNALRQ